MIELYYTYYDSKNEFENSEDWLKMIGQILPDKSKVFPNWVKSFKDEINLIVEESNFKFKAYFSPQNIYTAYRMLKERYEGSGKK